MKYLFLDENLKYDGSQLSAHFAYRNFNILGDSMVSFVGACDIPEQNMADLEDVIGGDEIYGDLMLHFIGEFFFYSLFETVLIQRMFAVIFKEEVEKISGKKLVRDGDDLFFEDGKLSISIATTTGVSTMFHFAANVKKGKAPVKIASLDELGINNLKEFSKRVFDRFEKEIVSVKGAVCKVRIK